MKVQKLYDIIKDLQSKTTYNMMEWELCAIVHTPDDKFVTAYSLEYDGNDGEGGIYLSTNPKVYRKDNEN